MYAQRIGLLGAVGFLAMAAWAVGFLGLGVHGALFHLLFPVGLFLMVAQGVRRIAL